jgi:hypothetical protein
MRRMPGVWITAVLLVLTLCPSRVAAQEHPLARAGRLYNEGQFTEAIESAELARADPQYADEADLIAARAHLELLRDVDLLQEGLTARDLEQARALLTRINPDRLDADARMDLLVGFGQALYFEAAPGAAAEVFESVLDEKRVRTQAERDRVLDWWASARDRQARPRGDQQRRAIYQTIRDRMREELMTNSSSAIAAYWLAAAAAGQGEWMSAWDTALAGWVRAPLTGDQGRALRGDLDQLIRMSVAPERAKILGRPRDELIQEWEDFKARWLQP